MTVRRIKVGPVGGVFGLYMSKPGVDVETAGENNMMFSPSKKFFQVIHERHITLPQTYRSSTVRVMRRIDHPDFGFVPLVTIDCNNRSWNYGGYVKQWNVVANPVARYPFGQSATGFWLVWHTINTYVAGIFNPGGDVTIRLYNIATATAGYGLPAHDIMVPDA